MLLVADWVVPVSGYKISSPPYFIDRTAMHSPLHISCLVVIVVSVQMSMCLEEINGKTMQAILVYCHQVMLSSMSRVYL